jgi:hypothetical protein
MGQMFPSKKGSMQYSIFFLNQCVTGVSKSVPRGSCSWLPACYNTALLVR